jgi:hypothetical protein
VLQWLVLAAACSSLILPAEVHAACDPSQCVREAEQLGSHGNSEADSPSDDAPADSDCGSPFHLCHCCAHVQVLASRASLHISAPRLAGLQPLAAAAAGNLSGHRGRLDRPPSLG